MNDYDKVVSILNNRIDEIQGKVDECREFMSRGLLSRTGVVINEIISIGKFSDAALDLIAKIQFDKTT